MSKNLKFAAALIALVIIVTAAALIYAQQTSSPAPFRSPPPSATLTPAPTVETTPTPAASATPQASVTPEAPSSPETSATPAPTQTPSNLTEEQIRDAVIAYLRLYHNETEQYLPNSNAEWQGGRVDEGMLVGSTAYSYTCNSWNVTMRYPVVPNPIYTITAEYNTSGTVSIPIQISWAGTWQNGTLTETSYSFAT